MAVGSSIRPPLPSHWKCWKFMSFHDCRLVIIIIFLIIMFTTQSLLTKDLWRNTTLLPSQQQHQLSPITKLLWYPEYWYYLRHTVWCRSSQFRRGGEDDVFRPPQLLVMERIPPLSCDDVWGSPRSYRMAPPSTNLAASLLQGEYRADVESEWPNPPFIGNYSPCEWWWSHHHYHHLLPPPGKPSGALPSWGSWWFPNPWHQDG